MILNWNGMTPGGIERLSETTPPRSAENADMIRHSLNGKIYELYNFSANLVSLRIRFPCVSPRNYRRSV